MREKLLERRIVHNEKPPRQDIMSIPTFELQEGDKIIFHFLAHQEGGFLKVHVEDADKLVKDKLRDRPLKLAEFYVINSVFYRIPKTGNYDFPIQNPFAGSEELGVLKMFREPFNDEGL